jgi:hypothetical protein
VNTILGLGKLFMKFMPLFGLVCMFLLSSVLVVNASTSTGIVVDGDPSDWTSWGLSPVGTDPPYDTPHSYDPVCSDLLEAWACKNETMVFLMMKVLGGAPNFTEALYDVNINVDPEGTTGYRGDDYIVSLNINGAYLYAWNVTLRGYDEISSEVTGKAGNSGYIEWGVPLNEIGGTASSLKLLFYTYDRANSQMVESLTVTLSPPVTIPEFPFILMLAVFLPLTAVTTIILSKRLKRLQTH